MKAQKFSLEEIRDHFLKLQRLSPNELVERKLADLQIHLAQVEREAKELEAVLDHLKPKQAAKLFRAISPRTAACVEALMLLLSKGETML